MNQVAHLLNKVLITLSFNGPTAISKLAEALGISHPTASQLVDRLITPLTFLSVGVVVLIAFVITELVVEDPVIDLCLFTNCTFAISNLLLWMVSAVLYGSLFLMPFFFENVQGSSSLTAGELLIGQGLAAAVSITISGRLYNRVGPRLLAITGLILLVVGTYGFTRLDVHTSGQSLQHFLYLLPGRLPVCFWHRLRYAAWHDVPRGGEMEAGKQRSIRR